MNDYIGISPGTVVKQYATGRSLTIDTPLNVVAVGVPAYERPAITYSFVCQGVSWRVSADQVTVIEEHTKRGNGDEAI